MPKPSKAQLEIAPIIPAARMEPPDDLTPPEQDIWRRIVARWPAEKFGPDNQQLLTQLCRHSHYANRLALQIEPTMAVVGTSDADVKLLVALPALLAAMNRQSDKINQLSRALRLTPQSANLPDRARDDRRKTASGPKPWEDWQADPDPAEPSGGGMRPQ